MTSGKSSGIRNQQVAGVALGLIGLAAIGMTFRYPLGDAYQPGPAYYPLILASLMTLLGVVVAVRADDVRLDLTTWWEKGRPAAIIVSLSLAALALEHLGFRMTMAALLLVLLGMVERCDWRVTLLIAVLFPAGAYALLHDALKIALPLNVLGI